MEKNNTAIIILAAGKGKRMVSDMPKCLHSVAGFPMIDHVVTTLSTLADQMIVVVADRHDAMSQHLMGRYTNIDLVVQAERLGTGDAVRLAMHAVKPDIDKVIVAYGDTPLLNAATFDQARALLEESIDLVVVGFHLDEPQGYGRLVVDNNNLVAIIEDKDATDAQKEICLCNSGFMVGRRKVFDACLPKLDKANQQGEYYLTDLVYWARQSLMVVGYIVVDYVEALGVNTRADLAMVEKLFQKSKRQQMMANGVTLRDPDSVYFALDTTIGVDSIIEPHVVFGPGVTLGKGTLIKGLCHLEGVSAGEDVSIGPFARLRPGSVLSNAVRIGNFVETKAVHLGEGTKAGHLSYLGNGNVGARSNIGAGTIFCNYDGVNKHETTLGENVFVGSNSALVAPVVVGDGAYIGSGSVITDDIPTGDLALGRGRQVNLKARAPKP